MSTYLVTTLLLSSTTLTILSFHSFLPSPSLSSPFSFLSFLFPLLSLPFPGLESESNINKTKYLVVINPVPSHLVIPEPINLENSAWEMGMGDGGGISRGKLVYGGL